MISRTAPRDPASGLALHLAPRLAPVWIPLTRHPVIRPAGCARS